MWLSHHKPSCGLAIQNPHKNHYYYSIIVQSLNLQIYISASSKF